MTRQIRCFISFSATDGNTGDIDYLIEYLEERLKGRVDFRIYHELRSGDDLGEFMRKDLVEAEAVLALFSPDYKKKADNHIKSGVLTEFKTIVDRIEGKIKCPKMQLIPVSWTGGGFEDAVPRYFVGRNLTRDLQAFHAFGTEGEAYLPSRIETMVRADIQSIVEDLLLRWAEADPEYAERRAEINEAILKTVAEPLTDDDDLLPVSNKPDDVLFPKAERAPMSLQDFSQRLFVKTSAYRAIGQYHRMAFTGRKGSGKTTLLKIYLHNNKSRFFEPIDIEVNDWRLHYILSDLTFRGKESDLQYTEEESRIFDFIWPVFLSLCMVKSISGSFDDVTLNDLIPNPQAAARFKKEHKRYEGLFALAIELVSDFFQSCIDEARTETESEFKADLMRMLNVEACTESVLGPSYRGLADAIRKDDRNRRFLFCLDRFDTEIQKYRKDLKDFKVPEPERQAREAREVYWIQGLVEMIDHLRAPDYFSQNQGFFKTFGPSVDFCVPLPRDRLYEVQRRRRDSIVGDIQEEISWRPYELLTMLRKRLQLIWRIEDNAVNKNNGGAKSRFDQVLDMAPVKLPDQIGVRINGAVFEMPLFLNVLRHTFFRPRDVNIYYARLVSAAEAAQRRKQPFSVQAAARVISNETYRIVKDEFLGEFDDTFKNIEAVINRFRAAPQVMPIELIEDILRNDPFDMYADDDLSTLGDKICFLYEIGFLGVCSAGAQLGSIPSEEFAFYFFKPEIANAVRQESVYKELKFAVHPVFIEYLTLKINVQEPVMYFDWEKINDLDSFE